jgi:hypothetical protein
MIRTDILLYQILHTTPDLQEARRMPAWTDPATGSPEKTENSPRFTHLFCESPLRQDADRDPNSVEAHFYLWKVLTRAKKKPDEAARLTRLAENPALAQRLKSLRRQP